MRRLMLYDGLANFCSLYFWIHPPFVSAGLLSPILSDEPRFELLKNSHEKACKAIEKMKAKGSFFSITQNSHDCIALRNAPQRRR